ncbi:hypothetical protein RGQ15_08480 [Paracoccus sp. MBLB3053]|uniref:Uncharacterized protein n=1 Tax=Paracoccus aurantius TaxID=3073814 RepID=A0ABU2HRC2_9RHOB|nr:hypothetical protein [Paracoccus sp. MBLB3053]MDS9467609.1 hypothetical protein [Paracoccus sp. MBLB3053]
MGFSDLEIGLLILDYARQAGHHAKERVKLGHCSLCLWWGAAGQ